MCIYDICVKLGSKNGVCGGLEGDIFEFVFVFSDCLECGGGVIFFPFTFYFSLLLFCVFSFMVRFDSRDVNTFGFSVSKLY